MKRPPSLATRAVALSVALALASPPVAAGPFKLVPARTWTPHEKALSRLRLVRAEPTYAAQVRLFSDATASHVELAVTGTAVNVLAQDWKTWRAREFDRPMAALAGVAWAGSGAGLGLAFTGRTNHEGKDLTLGGWIVGGTLIAAGTYWLAASALPARRADVKQETRETTAPAPPPDTSGLEVTLRTDARQLARLTTDTNGRANFSFQARDPYVPVRVQVLVAGQPVTSFSPFDADGFTEAWLDGRLVVAATDPSFARVGIDALATALPKHRDLPKIRAVSACLTAWANAEADPVGTRAALTVANTAGGVAARCADAARAALPDLARSARAVERADAEKAARCEGLQRRRVAQVERLVDPAYVRTFQQGLFRLRDAITRRAQAAVYSESPTEEETAQVQCMAAMGGEADTVFRGLYAQQGLDVAANFPGFDIFSLGSMNNAITPAAICGGRVRAALDSAVTGPIETYLHTETEWIDLGCSD